MRFAGLLIGFLAVSLMILPALPAQEKDKKDKDGKTEKEAKPEPEKKKVPEKKIEYGGAIKTKILSMKQDSARDFTVEVSMPDPQWHQQQMYSIQTAQNPQQYQQRMQAYQIAMAQGQGYTKKPIDVKASENCQVRRISPPIEYDDAGNLKKWTKKELDKLKEADKANGYTKLPGFPSDFDQLKGGQFVEVFFAKQHASPKDKGPINPKKKKDEDMPPDLGDTRPEIVMIVIWGEPMGR